MVLKLQAPNDPLQSVFVSLSATGTKEWETPWPTRQPISALLPTNAGATLAIIPASMEDGTPTSLQRIESDGSVDPAYPIGPSEIVNEGRRVAVATDGSVRVLMVAEYQCNVTAYRSDGTLKWQYAMQGSWISCDFSADPEGRTLVTAVPAVEGPIHTVLLSAEGSVAWQHEFAVPYSYYRPVAFGQLHSSGSAIVLHGDPGTDSTPIILSMLSNTGVPTSDVTLLSNSYPHGLWRAPDGRFFVAAGVPSSMTSSILISHLWAYDANGASLWDKQLDMRVSELTFIANGGVAIAGPLPIASDRYPLAVKRLDASGNVLSMTMVDPHQAGDIPLRPIETDDHALIFAFHALTADGMNYATQLMRIEPDGLISWRRYLLPGPYPIRWTDGALDARHQVILAGTRTASPAHGFVVGIDPATGDATWDNGFNFDACPVTPGCLEGAVNDMVLAPNGAIVWTGWEENQGHARTAITRRIGDSLFANSFE
jgi:hypothetical protein